MSQGHATQLLKHGMAEITPALRLHYGTGGEWKPNYRSLAWVPTDRK